MDKSKLYGAFILLGVVMTILIFSAFRSDSALLSNSPQVQEQRINTAVLQQIRQQKRLQTQIDGSAWWAGFWRWSALIIILSPSLSLLMYAGAMAGGYLFRSSVHIAKVNESEIPIHHRDLAAMTPAVLMMTNAQQIAAVSQQQAFEMVCEAANFLKHSGQRAAIQPAFSDLPAMPALTSGSVPPFSVLLDSGMIAPDKPLVMGFSNGEPQFRTHKDIKSCAVAGWQGSGKTLSMAYIITSVIVQYPTACVYVIDPHRNHEESLTTLIRPLESSGRLILVNPMDVNETILLFSQTLKRRIDGVESSDVPLFLVIDEMNKLCRTLREKEEEFDNFFRFLEECTEETRKANITFFGVSHKWDARVFKNRKDIRESMPSLMIHKSKPGQANLLLEGNEEKKLVKQLSQPGECLLATSHNTDPQIVKMSLITREDIVRVANGGYITVKNNSQNSQDDSGRDKTFFERNGKQESLNIEPEKPIEFVDPIDENKAFLQKIKEFKADQRWSQGELARQSDVDPGLLSKVLRGLEPLSNGVKKSLETLLTTGTQHDSTSEEKRRNVIDAAGRFGGEEGREPKEEI